MADLQCVSRLLCALVAIFLLLLPAVLGTQLSAWTTDNGTFVVYQVTGQANISHSYCNKGHTVTLPQGYTHDLDLEIKPKIGTSLTASGGHGDADQKIWAAVYYQSELNDIVEAFFICDMKTGLYGRFYSRILENSANGGTPLAVSGGTGLAVVFSRHEDDDVFHLFYKDNDYAIRMVTWSSADNEWLSDSRVPSSASAVPGVAMDAAYSRALDKFYVLATHADSSKIQISSGKSEGDWDNVVVPMNKEANLYWPGDPHSIGLTVDKDGNQTVYYIGTDCHLRRIVVDTDGNMHVPDIFASQQQSWRPHLKGIYRPDVTPSTGDSHSSLAIAAMTDSEEAYIYWDNSDNGISGLHLADGQLTPANPEIEDPHIGTGGPNDHPWETIATPTATESGIQAFPTSNPKSSDGSPPPAASSAPAAASPSAACDAECDAQHRNLAGVVIGTIFGIIALVCVCVFAYFWYKRWQGLRAERRRFRNWRPNSQAQRIGYRRWSSLADFRRISEPRPAAVRGGAGGIPLVPVAPVVAGVAAVSGAAAAGAVVVGAVAATVATPEAEDPEVSPVSSHATLAQMNVSPVESVESLGESLAPVNEEDIEWSIISVPAESVVSVPRDSNASLARIDEENEDAEDTATPTDSATITHSAPSIAPSLATTASNDSYDGEVQVACIGIAM